MNFYIKINKLIFLFFLMKFMQEAFYRLNLGMAKTTRGTIPVVAFSLKPEIAREFYLRELREEDYKKIQEDGKHSILPVGNLKKMGNIETPFSFFENSNGNLTYLLRWVGVPGDACDLGLEGTELNNLRDFFEGKHNFPPPWIEYTPHNVDSVYQAYALTSAWLAWATFAEAVTSTD